MSMWRALSLFAAFAVIPAATASARGVPSDDPGLLITNESQFELNQILVHSHSDYTAATNALTGPLAVDEGVLVPFSRDQYVTIVRRNGEFVEPLAVTTNRPLDVPSHGAELVVYDKSFRLYAPADAPNAAPQKAGCSLSQTDGSCGLWTMLALVALAWRRSLGKRS